jgi:hypothetical protein
MKLVRMRWWRRAWLRLWPPARRRYEAGLREMMRYLVEHPEIPVEAE